MKLKLIDYKRTQEYESDCDTAVEMSYCDTTREHYFLESESQMQIEVMKKTDVFSSSYLEEDTAHFEQTGHVIYNHVDNKDSKEKTEYYLYVTVEPRPIILSKSEFLEYFKHYCNKSKEEKENYPAEKSFKFEKFEEQQLGIDTESFTGIKLSSVEGELFINAIESALNNKVEVPSIIKNTLHDYELENIEIKNNNSQTWLNTMCDQATAKIAHSIDVSAEKAKKELKFKS